MTHGPVPAQAGTRGHDLLVFRIGAEHFATPLSAVEEAVDIDPAAVQALPDDNPALRGVFALRDALVPLFAPYRALGLAAGDGGTALVVRSGAGPARAAILVDDVEDVMNVSVDELQGGAAAEAGAVIRGVVPRAPGIVAIVDLNALVGACRAAGGGQGR